MSASRRRSLRTRFIMLRARIALPALLSQWNEQRIISFASAVNGGFAILTISLAAWLSGLPLLFPSLGPTAFLLFTQPFSRASAPRSIVLGHSISIACGMTAWGVVSLLFNAPISVSQPGLPLCLSAILGLAMACAMLVRLSCPHAPACASALIIATGAMTGWFTMLIMVGAVILLALQGTVIHRLAGVPAPWWSHDAHRHEHEVGQTLRTAA